ncbi:MAG: alpha/beta hydrolase, partial [Planctomycetota bacterium]
PRIEMPKLLRQLTIAFFALYSFAVHAKEPTTIRLWPSVAPGETKKLPPETDIYKPTDAKIAGRKIIKLANVTVPTLEIHRPPKEIDTGASVIICPGGGHYILAYDLEGTEVAEWLNKIGVTGIVLKYRVPRREENRRWRAAVQDAQRAVSVVRSRAKEWGLDPKRIGICGFSAGGETAGLTSIFTKRTYDAKDDHDKVSSRPDFALLVYAAGFVDKEGKLKDYVKVTKDTPPMFFAHTNDDFVSSLNPLMLSAELRKNGVQTAVHLWAKGGHGYGLRRTDQDVTTWPDHAETWMRAMKFLPTDKAKKTP